MVKGALLGEEITITTKNKVGLLADIALIMVNNGINIEAAAGFEVGSTAKILLITNANLKVIGELRKKRYKSIKETEVVLVDLENRPGALKLVTTELKNNKINIKHVYVTSCSCGGSSKMVLQTDDNERAMALLARYMPNGRSR
jgi:hypothetical protein